MSEIIKEDYLLLDEDQSKQINKFNTGNYMTLLAIILVFMIIFSLFSALIIIIIGGVLLISYKNFNFIFHQNFLSYYESIKTKINELFSGIGESQEEKLFKLVNI